MRANDLKELFVHGARKVFDFHNRSGASKLNRKTIGAVGFSFARIRDTSSLS
jgi:hypothetical protein